MNILFVFYVPSGGVDTLNRSRCVGLRKYGIRAHCLYYNWGAGIQNACDVETFVTNEDRKIKQIIEQGNYDFVIATTDHECFERFRRLGYKGKFILEIQGYGAKKTARIALTIAQNTIKKYASALLHPNTTHIAKLFDELFPEIPQFQFNNCFDMSNFTHRHVEKPNYPILAWLGRMDDNKNWREFILISYMLKVSQFPNLQLWIFEDPNLAFDGEREAMMNLIYHLKLEDRITFFSNIPNLDMQYYFSMIAKSGGLLCSTSKVEGGPVSILEAMSCCCPVLATNNDGIASSVIHDVTGKVYELGHISQAVAQAYELMNDTAVRAIIQYNAYQHIHQQFSLDRYCQNFINMLHAIKEDHHEI